MLCVCLNTRISGITGSYLKIIFLSDSAFYEEIYSQYKNAAETAGQSQAFFLSSYFFTNCIQTLNKKRTHPIYPNTNRRHSGLSKRIDQLLDSTANLTDSAVGSRQLVGNDPLRQMLIH